MLQVKYLVKYLMKLMSLAAAVLLVLSALITGGVLWLWLRYTANESRP